MRGNGASIFSSLEISRPMVCKSTRRFSRQRFGPHLGKIPGQVGWASYGVCFNFDGTGNFDYMCAVEVSETLPLPPPLTHLPVAAQRYAVFTHRDHISKIGKTWDAI